MRFAADKRGNMKIQFQSKSAKGKGDEADKIFLSKGVKRSTKSISNIIGNGKTYRGDLKTAALAKYTAMHRSMSRKSQPVFKQRRGRNTE
jgi:hypothetical protein